METLIGFEMKRQDVVITLFNNIITKTNESALINTIATVCSRNIASRVTPVGETDPLIYLLLLNLILEVKFKVVEPSTLETILGQTCNLIRIKYVRRKAHIYTLYLLIVLEFMKNNP
jgi:hypothetical protein